MKLNVNALGLACGIMSGVVVAVMTFTNVLWGYPGSYMGLLSDIYRWGYDVNSYWGILAGLIYGFIDGYVGGIIFAWLYNKLVKSK